jgi:hypothetical protein
MILPKKGIHMADKLGVSVDCVVKTIFDKALINDVKKFLGGKVKTAIGKSSKLELNDNPDPGFSMTVTLLELTKEDKGKPQIKAVIAIAILGSGITASTINLKTPANGDAGSNPAKFGDRAKDVIDALLDNMLPKVIKAMEAKAP